MKRIILGSLIAVTVTFTSAAADIMITDNDQTLTVDCAKDKNVSVQGNNAKLTLTGTCAAVLVDGNEIEVSGSVKRVLVNGNENVLTLDAVDAVVTNGNNNRVTWKRTVTKTKKKPGVSNPGNGNKIAKVK